MFLLREMLTRMLMEPNLPITFPDLTEGCIPFIEMYAYHALEKIKSYVDDPSLSDKSCIICIINVFEELNSFTDRHLT